MAGRRRRATPIARKSENHFPGPTWLVAWNVPPMSSASFLDMAKPRPVPPKRRVTDASAWVKASKMDCSLSSGIPTPVSRTLNSSIHALVIAGLGSLISRGKPMNGERDGSLSSVNFKAFPTRFINICPQTARIPQQLNRDLRVHEAIGFKPFVAALDLQNGANVRHQLRS